MQPPTRDNLSRCWLMIASVQTVVVRAMSSDSGKPVKILGISGSLRAGSSNTGKNEGDGGRHHERRGQTHLLPASTQTSCMHACHLLSGMLIQSSACSILPFPLPRRGSHRSSFPASALIRRPSRLPTLTSRMSIQSPSPLPGC